MKTDLKPANSKARALLKKLLALAERGIDGEKASAQRKIRRPQRHERKVPPHLQPLTAARLCELRDEYTRTLEAALRLPRNGL
jgi:hypothetical protein